MMRLSHVAPALALWLIAELAAFMAVADAIGFGGAILVGVLTTLLGFSLLRENAAVAMQRVRAAFEGSAPRNGALAEGLIGALGALLLILPGFLSDLAGLVLTIPSVRAELARRAGAQETLVRRRREANSGVLDLNPGEWRVADTPQDRASR